MWPVGVWVLWLGGDVTHKIWKSFEEYHKLLSGAGLKVKYVGFNFARSNEKIWWMRWLSVLLTRLDGGFYRYLNVDEQMKVKIFAKLCTSVDYICEL